MHEWYDSLTLGEKMHIWAQYQSEGQNKFIEKAYSDYLRNFKLEIV